MMSEVVCESKATHEAEDLLADFYDLSPVGMMVQNESVVKGDIHTEVSSEICLADLFNLQAVGLIYPLSRIYSICSKYSKQCIGIPGKCIQHLNVIDTIIDKKSFDKLLLKCIHHFRCTDIWRTHTRKHGESCRS